MYLSLMTSVKLIVFIASNTAEERTAFHKMLGVVFLVIAFAVLLFEEFLILKCTVQFAFSLLSSISSCL